MSIARQHNEWLSLVEVSGPFLSLPVLLKVFPQGLDAHDAEMSKNVRLAFGEWEEHRQDVAIHTAWLEFVLKRTLGYPDDYLLTGQAMPDGLEARVQEHGETLRPTYALKAPSETLPRMLVSVYPPSQALTKPVAGTVWKTGSPDTRMMTLLRATGVPLGLVTNGEKWLLVAAKPGETTSYITWDAGLWSEEPLTLRAFVALLGVRRFFGVAESEALPHMLAESALNQQEVTDQLGQQVLKAVEVLIHALDRINVEQHGHFLGGVGEKELYQAALTVMMRLVFLLSAEERGLLLLGDALYDRHYAISTLRDQLRETPDEQLLEHRHDAWGRFLAACRAIYGGVEHEAMRLPAYGGALFDPNRYPFLEGRKSDTSWIDTPAAPLPINNRTVLHLLESLQFLHTRVPGGGIEPRRLSFRALDIEQIGHVYEGLLDHTAKRACSPVIGLKGSDGKNVEIALEELEERANAGEGELVDYLKELTGRSPAALKRALAQAHNANQISLQSACGTAKGLYERLKPYALLIREDTNGYPVIVHEGSVYVTSGSDRRSTGTHYTPRSLTEPIVRATLEPLLYEGFEKGQEPAPERLLSATEILALKVCDFTCGSGAFLVQACRYLSERVVEAWNIAEANHPDEPLVVPEATPSGCEHSELLLPLDQEERLALARRLVAERCLYGVDVNPMAVEMAKLSLWLVTLHKSRPFTFLDHAIKCGDSLLGLHSSEQIGNFHLLPSRVPLRLDDYIKQRCVELLELARRKREQLEQFTVYDIRDAETKSVLYAESELILENARVIADLVVGAGIATASGGGLRSLNLLEVKLEEYLLDIGEAFKGTSKLQNAESAALQHLRQKAQHALATNAGDDARRPFHWLVEFPEVMLRSDNPGFDAVVGNPPFAGGRKLKGLFGENYRQYLVEYVAEGRRGGNADLCAYFFLRAGNLLKRGGNFGLLAVNTIAEGDSRQLALEPMLHSGFAIYAASPDFSWPGVAAVAASSVQVHRGSWCGPYKIDGRTVGTISAFLSSEDEWSPRPLRENANKAFQGSIVLGQGFILSDEAARELLRRDSNNKRVLFPYLSGEDLNSHPEQRPTRWVICFWDWPLERSCIGDWENSDEAQRAMWFKEGVVPKDYPGFVAADFPDILAIVEEKVKPERQRRNEKDEYVLRKPLPERWWHFADKRPALYHAIGQGGHFARHPETWKSESSAYSQVLAYARHSKFWCPSFVSSNMIFSDALGVNAMNSFADFALLQSSVHAEWAWKMASSLESRLRYTASDVLEPFPFPVDYSTLESVGGEYVAVRRDLMKAAATGLTQTYNQFHSEGCMELGVVELRRLQIQIDKAVAAAYGWGDLELRHDFYAVPYLPDNDRMRFTICEEARLEVLRRLSLLNRERYAAEQLSEATSGPDRASAGRSDRKNGKALKKTSAVQADLF
ncbi:Eco57I restriction-modification methylase domain-containing protein [Burkholderia pseudomallei]|uniref:Eco57I restriction-modification methylase domain-containing protein n=1 Tax=Burkholderia pseudomallei TaxID=28450 RepID=UPI000F0847E8|nr:DNA methyltransferase [Burkholderia pseudomallei]CAJ2766337.1 Type I restriction-modification system methyltransferase subunit [Burkholderia pseudomallei]VCJ20428.1 Type I restriction-modification system methyltransferase subunit [Burkholderia pseudomallei]